MAQQVQDTLARALERARREGVRITARGTVKATGQRFYTVQGTRGQYVVLVSATRLSCSCPAHGICKHRAVVREDLTRQASAARVLREVREVAVAAERATAPLRRDNRPVSIWK